MPPELHDLSTQLEDAAAEASGLLEIARGIHPALLAAGGLGPALNALARRFPIPVDLRVNVEGRLLEQVEVTAYYVVAEAMTNAAKHADASAVSVEVEVVGEALHLAVRDGLIGLKDRVQALGSRIFLESPHGAGTSLRAQLPLAGPNGGVTSG